MANPLVPVVMAMLTATQTHHLRLLGQIGVNKYMPGRTADVLKRHRLIEWTGGQHGGWVLTDAGKALLPDGVALPLTNQPEQP
jgi:hypothetical protein